MVEGKQMGKGLLEGMDVLKGIALALISLVVILIIGLLIVGVLGQTATSGSINVSTGINTSIAGLETITTTNVTNITSNLQLIIGLVALVVILLVIGWMVFKKEGKKSSVDF